MKPLHDLPNRRLGCAALLALMMAGCGGDSSGPTPVRVSVTSDQGELQPGASAQVTATTSDNSHVRWTVSCPSATCGAVSPAETASGTATTYTAPSERPKANVSVTITAKSTGGGGSATGATAITVDGGVAISVVPASSPGVAAGTTAQFTATVENGSANEQVIWSVSCLSAPCGSVSPTTTASGIATVYTAPPLAVSPDPIADPELDVTLTASLSSDKSVSGSAQLSVPYKYVLFTTPDSMSAGTSTTLVATVNADPANQGVTWKLSCTAADCGTLSSSASASSAPITYTAPATPPLAEVAVTVTATTVSAPVAQAAGVLKIEPIGIGVTPVSALIPLKSAQQFTGTLASDLGSDQVAWSLQQAGAPCPSGCGSATPAATASGAATTYTAPSVMPANPSVVLSASSVMDATKVVTAMITLTSGSVQLVPASLAFVKISGRECCVPPPQTVTVTNTGAATLSIQGIAIGGTDPNAFSQTDACSGSVAPGTSCVITVKFQYKNCTNSCAAVLQISDGSSDSPQQVPLTGTRKSAVSSAALAALARQATAAVPAPSGPAAVGSRTLHLVDATRTDPYQAGTTRELMLRLWYPRQDNPGCLAAEYTPPAVWAYFSSLLKSPLPRVATSSCRDAAVAVGRHALVFIEHGYTGTFTDYTFLAEDLASRGYVVAAIDHTHEATAVAFPDGRLEKSVFGSHLTQWTRNDRGVLELAVAVRLGDLRFALAELTRLSASGGDLGDRLDLGQIALIGHSLGGLTTLRALESEPRFKAGIVLDSLPPPHFARPIQQPVLTLAVGRQGWNEDDCLLWDSLHGPRTAVNLPGLDHLALSDAVWLLDGALSSGSASPQAAVSVLRTYVADFLDANLRGQAAPGSAARMAATLPDAVVASGADRLCGRP